MRKIILCRVYNKPLYQMLPRSNSMKLVLGLIVVVLLWIVLRGTMPRREGFAGETDTPCLGSCTPGNWGVCQSGCCKDGKCRPVEECFGSALYRDTVACPMPNNNTAPVAAAATSTIGNMPTDADISRLNCDPNTKCIGRCGFGPGWCCLNKGDPGCVQLPATPSPVNGIADNVVLTGNTNTKRLYNGWSLFPGQEVWSPNGKFVLENTRVGLIQIRNKDTGLPIYTFDSWYGYDQAWLGIGDGKLAVFKDKSKQTVSGQIKGYGGQAGSIFFQDDGTLTGRDGNGAVLWSTGQFTENVLPPATTAAAAPSNRLQLPKFFY